MNGLLTLLLCHMLIVLLDTIIFKQKNQKDCINNNIFYKNKNNLNRGKKKVSDTTI